MDCLEYHYCLIAIIIIKIVIVKGYVKIDTSDTFYESFLEITYSVSSKLEKFNEENGKQRSLETKIQLLENEAQNLQNLNLKS